MIILFNGFYYFCMFVSKHFVKRVRPKNTSSTSKSTLVSRHQPGEIFLSFRRPHSRICIFKLKKKMTKRQNKLRRKREYLGKTRVFVILQQPEVRTFKNKNKRKSLRHIFLSFSLLHLFIHSYKFAII